MRGRHAGHPKLNKTGQINNRKCMYHCLFQQFTTLGQGEMKEFPAILFFEVAIIQFRPLKKTALKPKA